MPKKEQVKQECKRITQTIRKGGVTVVKPENEQVTDSKSAKSENGNADNK